MKMRHTILLLAAATALLFPACSGGGRAARTVMGGDTLHLKYAENITIVEYDNYTMVTLRNPWDTLRTLHTYILTDRNRPEPDYLPAGTVIPVPVQRGVFFSSVHCSLVDQLGAGSCIKGVCDRSYIKLPSVIEGCRNGSIADLGSGLAPDMEKFIDLAPEAVFPSPFENSGGYGRLEKIGTAIVECADYMETSALGRAEWMRFYGRLVGKAAQADSLFRCVEQEYLALKKLAAEAKHRPTVISELKFGASWFTACGRSTMGRIMADAGADYVFAYLNGSGSVPLSFETVFDRGSDADIWIVKYNQAQDKTYRELAADYPPYAGFKAYRERRIYGCNTGRTAYYEEWPFHPELLLKDLIKVFHPSLLPGYQSRYYFPMAE